MVRIIPIGSKPGRGLSAVYIKPIYRYRMGRMAWSLLRHPRRSREFPAKHERLITADELMRFAT
nr:hypothetical protein CPGR_02260 [Mycolicibacter nonchromogenicus]